MEVAVLTARLEAQTATFLANMRLADQMLKGVQTDALKLDAEMRNLSGAMAKLGLDRTKIDQSRNMLRDFGNTAGSLRDTLLQTGEAAKGVGVSQMDATASIGAIDRETRAVKQLRDAYLEAGAASKLLNFPGGVMTNQRVGRDTRASGLIQNRGGPTVPDQGPGFVGGAAQAEWTRLMSRTGIRTQGAFAGGAPSTYISDADRMAEFWADEAAKTRKAAQEYTKYTNEVRNLSKAQDIEAGLERLRRGAGIPLGVSNGPDDRYLPGELAALTPGQRGAIDFMRRQAAARGAEPGEVNERIRNFLSGVEAEPLERGGGLLSGGRGRRGGGGFDGGNLFQDLLSGGGRYRRGGRYNVPGPNVLAGILPGGSRARPAALASLALGIGALGPAAIPAAAGLGVGAAGAITGLVGAAATLKLAFADISAAAFTSKAAFDALTPAQKSLVTTLRSLDAGVMTPLEHLAQSNLLPQLTTALHKAISPNLVGALQSSVGSFATNIGQGAQNVAGIVGSAEFSQNFKKVMVADSFYVNQFITDIGKLGDSFFRVLAVAKPFTDWLSGLGVKFSDWIEAVTRTTAANGQMAQFFEHAKVGLQAIGGLVTDLLRLLGSFGDAIGFQNSIGMIKLLSSLLQFLTNFIKSNQNVIRDFFAGALAAARDVIAVISPIVNGLSTILNMINKLIGGVNGWRVALDALLVFFTIKWVAGIIGGFAKIGLAEDAMVGSTQTLRLALLSLSSVEVLAGLAAVAAAVYAIYNPGAFLSPGKDPSRGHGTGIISASEAAGLIKGKTPFATNAGMAKASYDLGGGQLLAQEKDGKWKLYHMSGSVEVPGLASGFNAPASVRAAVASSAPTKRTPTTPVGDVSFLNPATAVNQLITSSMGLPADIQAQVAAASAGHGNMEKANAAAYAYYNTLLKIKGLTKDQKTLIYQAQAPYTPPPPFQQTGGGSVGFSAPSQAGGAVFNAQQAMQEAMVTGSGVSFGQQVKLAKQYESAAANAYQHLKNQKVAVADRAAKQAQLTALLKDESEARKAITTIMQHQTTANIAAAKAAVSAETATVSSAKATFSTVKSAGGSYRDLNAAANQYLSVLHKQQSVLEKQVKNGKDAVGAAKELKTISNDIKQVHITLAKAQEKMADDSRKTQISQHRTVISSIRSNLSSGVSGAQTPEDALKAVNRALIGSGKQLEQLKALKQKLLDQDNQTTKLKSEENQIQKEINSTLGVINTAQKDQAKALKAQVAAGVNKKWEKIFGLGSGETASVQSVQRQERNALLHIVRTLPHAVAKHTKGMTSSTDPLGAIPGAAGMSIDQLIKALQGQGVHFSKQALTDFKHIKDYLGEVKKLGIKIDPAIRDKITGLLQQIEQNTRPTTEGFTNLNAVTTEQHILKAAGIHITGTKAERAKFMQQANEALQNKGKLFQGSGAAEGVPLNPGGSPALVNPVAGGFAIPHHVSGSGHVEMQRVSQHARQLQGVIGDAWKGIAPVAHAVTKAAEFIVHNKVQKRDNLEMALDTRLDAKARLPGGLAAWLAQNIYEHPYRGPEGAEAVRMGSHGTSVPTTVNIIVQGYDKDKKELANEIYKIFQNQRRRNTTQMTGANAGRNLGSGLG